MSKVRRIYSEKKKGYDIEAQDLFKDIIDTFGFENLKGVRIINRYDIQGISDEVYEMSKYTVFSEPTVDVLYEEELNIDYNDNNRFFQIEYLPGQYDQRADSAEQCIQILTHGDRPLIKTGKIIVLQGDMSDKEYEEIKSYCINPVESCEVPLDKPDTLETVIKQPDDVNIYSNFINFTDEELNDFLSANGFAMDIDDIKFCQTYFKNAEKRNPTVTELKMIDTYWSDHCRHTTFLTRIDKVEFSKGKISNKIRSVYDEYLKIRNKNKDICLMDIATIAMKYMKRKGILDNLDESDEINACSIQVNVNIDGKDEDWLIMFKNETHNHPTEIEPFGGAATCLGGAIRDPLSGRAYVYQAMRVTGAGDPRTSLKDTHPNKLSQKKITVGAAEGYSSYGNQIGLATGHVSEIYHSGYVAKRMEIGAVIGAAPKENVIRKKPQPDDVIILLGGKTGRDGCGGATGSSKAHTDESLKECGAEVQKGNPPEERKIQRLFRKKEVTNLIKKCNDFGAGGVSVAIGELADGLVIDLDSIPKKYEGLDGTELAISESQERMAVVVSKQNADTFIEAAKNENLEATKVARVTSDNRLKMYWRGNVIVDISREFLNSNGADKNIEVKVTEPSNNMYFTECKEYKDIKQEWLKLLSDLNVCSQKGLVERFDSTIGAGTVNLPFGGKYQLTPSQSMIAKIPLIKGDTKDGTIMAYGYDPKLSSWSPFHGAVYAIVEAVSKIVASGGSYENIRLSLQEYFEKLGDNPEKWGKPLSALLGAFYAQMELNIPAIGGKDSMSGSFLDMNVPPTLVAFGVNKINIKNVISGEFKKANSKVVYLPIKKDSINLPDFNYLKQLYNTIYNLIKENNIISSYTVKGGGIAEAIFKMCIGNMIGFKFENEITTEKLFKKDLGSIIIELKDDNVLNKLNGLDYDILGNTQEIHSITCKGTKLDLNELIGVWTEPLEKIFPTRTDINTEKPVSITYDSLVKAKPNNIIAKPRIFIPVFPGTNCEYDTQKVFEQAGGSVKQFIFKNIKPQYIEDSIKDMAKEINNSQIIMLPGGFSAGDEPEGSGKFIATIFRNEYIKEAVMDLIKNRDGLILGICNGFQALIKLGLVPYGEIKDIDENCPTLTFNRIGRHVSCMVNTKIVSNLSPWFSNVNVGDIHKIPVSHGEGRFVANDKLVNNLFKNGQIAAQYVDDKGEATYDIRYNPNGSYHAIEAITSPDGRILGKMGHSERIGRNLYKNVPGIKDQKIFDAGVKYFR